MSERHRKGSRESAATPRRNIFYTITCVEIKICAHAACDADPLRIIVPLPVPPPAHPQRPPAVSRRAGLGPHRGSRAAVGGEPDADGGRPGPLAPAQVQVRCAARARAPASPPDVAEALCSSYGPTAVAGRQPSCAKPSPHCPPAAPSRSAAALKAVGLQPASGRRSTAPSAVCRDSAQAWRRPPSPLAVRVAVQGR